MTKERVENKLKSTTCASAARGARLQDGGNLYLICSPTTDRKTFVWYFRIKGKDKEYTIGRFGRGPGFVTLEDARKERNRVREVVKNGGNPTTQRAVAVAANIDNDAETFAKNARLWFETWKTSGVAPKGILTANADLEKIIIPRLGAIPMRDMKGIHVEEFLMRYADRRPTAKRLRQTISKVFRHNANRLDLNVDPTMGVRDLLKPAKAKPHDWIYLHDAPAFFTALDESGAMKQDIVGTKILFLTFVRADNLAAASWSEFDLTKGFWYIPGPRMKMTVPHIVPLARQTIALLRELKAMNPPDCPVLFPFVQPNKAKKGPRAGDSKGRATMSQPTRAATLFLRVIDRSTFKGKVVAHGFRGTASTFLHGVEANELPKYRDDAISIQMAHSEPTNEKERMRRIYMHNKFLTQRARMMQDYADAVFSGDDQGTADPDNVVVQLCHAA